MIPVVLISIAKSEHAARPRGDGGSAVCLRVVLDQLTGRRPSFSPLTVNVYRVVNASVLLSDMQFYRLKQSHLKMSDSYAEFDDDSFSEDVPPAYQYHTEPSGQLASPRARPLPIMPMIMPMRPGSSASMARTYSQLDETRTVSEMDMSFSNDDARTEVSMGRMNTINSGVGSVRSGASSSSYRRRDRDGVYSNSDA